MRRRWVSKCLVMGRVWIGKVTNNSIFYTHLITCPRRVGHPFDSTLDEPSTAMLLLQYICTIKVKSTRGELSLILLYVAICELRKVWNWIVFTFFFLFLLLLLILQWVIIFIVIFTPSKVGNWQSFVSIESLLKCIEYSWFIRGVFYIYRQYL